MRVLLGTQQLVVEFADTLQGGLQFLIIVEPLLDGGDDLGAEADLLGATTGVTDGQHPNRVTFAVGTDRAAGTMTDVAMEQRAAENLGGGRDLGNEFGSSVNDF